MVPDSLVCPQCEAVATGAFCSSCGARYPVPGDDRFWPFLREQAAEVTSADGRLWRTLKALFVPGKLTQEYFCGRRGLYVRPVRLFLVINLVLFVAMGANKQSTIKGPLRSHFHASVYGSHAEEVSGRMAAEWGVDEAVFEATFDDKANTLAPTLISVSIPVFALVLALVLLGTRSPGVRHFVLAIHAVSAFIAGNLLLMSTLVLAARIASKTMGMRFENVDTVLIPLIFVLIATYMVIALRRVYGLSVLRSVVTGCFVGSVGIAFSLWVYRLTLFYVAVFFLERPT